MENKKLQCVSIETFTIVKPPQKDSINLDLATIKNPNTMMCLDFFIGSYYNSTYRIKRHGFKVIIFVKIYTLSIFFAFYRFF